MDSTALPTSSSPHGTYRICGRAVRVTFGAPGSAVLERELGLYPRLPSGTPADFVVDHGALPEPGTILANPSIHHEHADGFTMMQTAVAVRFVLDGDRIQRVHFDERRAPSKAMRAARRMADMQRVARDDRAGIHLHEAVLMPALHFDPERILVHASALQADSGEVTLIAGTGGMGKASLGLELCLHHGFHFVAADVSVLDLEGHVYPNLAYPKIYAYNLEDNDELAARVLGGRGPLDRLHWHIHRSRGANKVRRRVSPKDLYGGYSAEGGPLGRYVILARETRSAVSVESVEPEQAAALSVSVMATEYASFHNHLYWHSYNRGLRGHAPACHAEVVLERWRQHLAEVLQAVSCQVVRIPMDLPHATFKHEMAALLAG